MADETKTEPTPAQAMPEKIELLEIEQLKLQATSSRIGKVIAEYQLAQSNMQQLKTMQGQREKDIEELNQKQDALLNEIGSRLGVGPSIRKYRIDLNTGKGELNKPPTPPAPPKG